MQIQGYSSEQQTPPQRIVISKIHLNIKFSCRLNLEYRYQGSTIKTKEIRIEPREKHYVLEEQIKKDENNGENMMNITVKLISNKGVSFTAGIIPINIIELPANQTSHKINLIKALDPGSYCQCRCISNFTRPIRESRYQLSSSPSRYQLRSYQAVTPKTEKDKIQNWIQDSQEIFPHVKVSEHRRYQTHPYSSQEMSSEYPGKLEDIQSELHKSNLTIQKQNQIITMLQSDKKRISEELTQLKIQLRSSQNDLDEKRYRIRQLDSQKLNLMMQAVTTDKEISFLKERAHETMLRTYQICKKLMNLDERNHLLRAKQYSMSQLQWAKEADQSYKLPNTSHKFYSKQDLPWQEESQVFREQPGLLSSCNMNEFSISNIEKHRDEVSLGNSEHFAKPNHTFSKPSLCESLKAISDEIKRYCHKIQKMVNDYHNKSQKELKQLKDRNRHLLKENHQFEQNQQSLLCHLEELQGGLESRITAVAMRDEALLKAREHIEHLEMMLAEKDSNIVQLEAKINSLQEEREQLENELHEVNYEYAQKQEKLIASLTIQKPISPIKNHNISPKVVSREKRYSMTDFDNNQHKTQIIRLKEQIRALQLEISHKESQHEELQLTLRKTETELSKCQFTMHLKQRMNSLNESIELSEHSQHEGATEQTEPEEDFKQLFKD